MAGAREQARWSRARLGRGGPPLDLLGVALSLLDPALSLLGPAGRFLGST